jgi:alkaline phosphatase
MLILRPLQTDTKYWMDLGANSINEALAVERNEGVAKNAIIYVGDGMGLATITAGRIFKGQLQGQPGEEGYLNFEKFANLGLLKVNV